MRNKRRIPIGTVLLALLVLFVFSFSIREFAKSNRNAILERNAVFLREHTEHHAKAVADILQSRLRFVENLAVLAGRSSENDYLSFIDTLDTIEENTFLDSLFFVSVEGKGYPFSGQQPDLKGTEFFQKGMGGESGISEMRDSLVNPDKQCVYYYAPVWRDGNVAGIVVGCNYYESFGDIYEMTPSEAYVNSFLADRSGNVLLSGKVEEKENFFLFLQERLEPEAYREFLDDIKNSDTVFSRYRGDYGDGLVCFSALGINDWYILQLFPSEKTAEIVAPLNKSAYALQVAMLLCLVLTVAYTLFQTYRKYNQKNRLMEMALEAMADSYPRIAKINYDNETCIFIKEREGVVEKTFQKYDWTPIRTKLQETIHPEDLEKFRSFTSQENMRRVREQGFFSDTCIYRRKYKGKYQWIQSEILPVEGEEDCILMYARKVDETVKAEESYKQQLWKTMQRVKAAEAEKAELLRYMSRNLRIPVKAMTGMALLTDESVRKEQNEEAVLYLDRVDSLGKYTLTMLDDIMQIGVSQESHIRCNRDLLSVRRMLDGYREYCREIKQTDRGVRVEVMCDEHLKDWYIGDEARIMQVLHAFLENAFRFSREEGLVVLRADIAEAGEKTDCVTFAVCDAGQGMDEEYRTFLAEALSEKGRSPEGTESVLGMGLTLAKLALESMGGRVKIESKQGEGTSFTMFLNLEHAPESGQKLNTPLCVLVVDDNEINMEATAEILEADGYKTIACSGGEEALKLFLDSEPGVFQVLLTDIKMPGMDGKELTKRVRESGRKDCDSICILGMTVSCDEKERAELVKSGLEDVIEKPFRLTWFNEFLQKREKRGIK